MSYQPKTTLITITVVKWSEVTNCTIDSCFSASHAVAVRIASRCQMDIMSIAARTSADECLTTVVYVNNGHSLADIQGMMASEINNSPTSYWMIQDLTEWQGMLDCLVSVRGDKEEWV